MAALKKVTYNWNSHLQFHTCVVKMHGISPYQINCKLHIYLKYDSCAPLFQLQISTNGLLYSKFLFLFRNKFYYSALIILVFKKSLDVWRKITNHEYRLTFLYYSFNKLIIICMHLWVSVDSWELPGHVHSAFLPILFQNKFATAFLPRSATWLCA